MTSQLYSIQAVLGIGDIQTHSKKDSVILVMIFVIIMRCDLVLCCNNRAMECIIDQTGKWFSVPHK